MTLAVDHARDTRLLARALDRAKPPPGPPFRCPYLAGRVARQLTVLPRPLVAGTYHALMDLNFRRLGDVFYRPACADCDACRMIRVPVREFRPSRAQRRCLRRNIDLTVEAAVPAPAADKHALYRRYLAGRHDGTMDGSWPEYEHFLYSSPVESLEVTYRERGRLVAAAIVDIEPEALSAVYCYYDPAERPRGLGSFNILWLIEESRRRGLSYLYLGYYVAEAPRMSYKARFRPCEVLDPGLGWRRL